MKVAMVGHKVIPSRRGGIENVLTSLCPLLVEKGIDVTCYNRSSDKVENEYIGTVKDKKYKGVTLKNAWTINRKGLSAMVASFTAAICAAFWKYDIVHFHAEGPCAAMWIPKMFGKKCVATVHGLDWQREKWGKGFASKYIKFGEKVMVKFADEIIVLSESAREYFKNTYNRETLLIHNGIEKPEKKEAGSHRRASGGAHRRAAGPCLRRALLARGSLHRQGRPGGKTSVSGYAAFPTAPAILLCSAARCAHAQPAQHAAQGDREKSVSAADAGHVGRAAGHCRKRNRTQSPRGHRFAWRRGKKSACIAHRRTRGAQALVYLPRARR